MIVAGHQQTTQDWWANRRSQFECSVSQVVIDEASVGDPAEVQKRLTIIGAETTEVSTGWRFRRHVGALARHAKLPAGFGLMLGMELTIPGKQIVQDAMADGLLINCTHDTVLRFLPPYTVTEKEVDAAIKILDGIFASQPSQ